MDPTDFNIIYAETQSGNIYRRDLRTGQNARVRPQPPMPEGGAERERYRFDWNTPFFLSPHNPQTLYVGGNKVFKSVDRGDTFIEVSPDLTALPEERSSALVSLAESPLVQGLLWAGIQRRERLGPPKRERSDWELLNGNIPDAPEQYWIKDVEASNHEAGRAFVAFDGHRHMDLDPHIYMTDDYGETWTNITGEPPGGIGLRGEGGSRRIRISSSPGARWVSSSPSIEGRPGRGS